MRCQATSRGSSGATVTTRPLVAAGDQCRAGASGGRGSANPGRASSSRCTSSTGIWRRCRRRRCTTRLGSVCSRQYRSAAASSVPDDGAAEDALVRFSSSRAVAETFRDRDDVGFSNAREIASSGHEILADAFNRLAARLGSSAGAHKFGKRPSLPDRPRPFAARAQPARRID